MREAAVTPFMITVQNLLHGEPAPAPRTVASTERSVAEAAHSQVELRSLAEQLVSEANAVLRDHGNVIELRDEAGAGRLAFVARELTDELQDGGDVVAVVEQALQGKGEIGVGDRPLAEGCVAAIAHQLAGQLRQLGRGARGRA